MIDLKTLQWRLAETINWCTSRVNPDDPQNCLRSPELDPQLDLDALNKYLARDFYFEAGMQEVDSSFHRRIWDGRADAEIGSFQTAMAKVVTRRAQLLRKNYSYPITPLEKLKTGRLLLYFPDDNTRDGAVPNETDNFFDQDDIPPWDTWVCFVVSDEPNQRRCIFILCWIPPEFEDLAASAIGVSMLESVMWADKLDEKYTIPELKENKLWPVLEAFLAQISN